MHDVAVVVVADNANLVAVNEAEIKSMYILLKREWSRKTFRQILDECIARGLPVAGITRKEALLQLLFPALKNDLYARGVANVVFETAHAPAVRSNEYMLVKSFESYINKVCGSIFILIFESL